MKRFNDLFSKGLSSLGRERLPLADKAANDTEEPQVATPLMLRISGAFWVDVACAVWKLREIVTDPITHEARNEMRPLVRHVDAIWDALAAVGIDIQDHTNMPFDSGQSLEVLAFQPTAGVTEERVSETVKPTIYLKGNRLQVGQVIVATPSK
jgi:hypothetical protein